MRILLIIPIFIAVKKVVISICTKSILQRIKG